MSTEDDEKARQRLVAQYQEQEARRQRWYADPQAMRNRLRALVAGGPPDPEAVEWAEHVVHVASSASFKIWTMYVRGETQRKSELDELLAVFKRDGYTDERGNPARAGGR